MNTSIVSKRIELTEPIREYIESAMSQLDKYNLDIIAIKAIIGDTKKEKKEAFAIEFTIQLAHRDTVVIKQINDDLYAAIDLAIERVKKVLRRFKEKINNKIHGHTTDKTPSDADIPDLYNDVDEMEVVPATLDNDKPMEIEDAMKILEEGDLMFFVFDDMEGRRRTIYRRKDGRFGLY
jgi:putative sigma-54 modulation protein